jgi:hypothetical protein
MDVERFRFETLRDTDGPQQLFHISTQGDFIHPEKPSTPLETSRKDTINHP